VLLPTTLSRKPSSPTPPALSPREKHAQGEGARLSLWACGGASAPSKLLGGRPGPSLRVPRLDCSDLRQSSTEAHKDSSCVRTPAEASVVLKRFSVSEGSPSQSVALRTRKERQPSQKCPSGIER
jgi:hypothetical protein